MDYKKAIGWLGTGIFFYLTISSLEAVISRSLRNALILADSLAPLAIHGIATYGAAALSVFLFFRLKSWAFTNAQSENSVNRAFRFCASSYIAAFLLQFFYSFLIEDMIMDEAFMVLLQRYYEGLQENFMVRDMAINFPATVIPYLIIGVVILRELKSSR